MFQELLPDELKRKDDSDEKKATGADAPKKPRTDDWWLDAPYNMEWNYRLVPPARIYSQGAAEGRNGADWAGSTHGAIRGTAKQSLLYTPDLNQLSGFSGEAPFNGVQAVRTTVVPTLALQNAGGNIILTWTPAGAALQSSTNVAGPFTTVTGATSPFTNAVTSGNAFFRVKD